MLGKFGLRNFAIMGLKKRHNTQHVRMTSYKYNKHPLKVLYQHHLFYCRFQDKLSYLGYILSTRAHENNETNTRTPFNRNANNFLSRILPKKVNRSVSNKILSHSEPINYLFFATGLGFASSSLIGCSITLVGYCGVLA